MSAQRIRGFTLIEVMIALAITAALFLLLFDGLRVGQRAGAAVAAQSERADALGAFDQFLRQRLQQAQPVLENGNAPRGVLAFDGEPAELSFVAPMPPHAAQAGLFRFVVGFDPAAGRVWLRYRRFLDPAWDSGAGAAEAVEMTLGERIASLEFAYLESRPDGSGRWRDQWRQRAELPAAVRVRVRAAGGTRLALERIVALRVDALL